MQKQHDIHYPELSPSPKGAQDRLSKNFHLVYIRTPLPALKPYKVLVLVFMGAQKTTCAFNPPMYINLRLFI
ncbi:uncharacterized protein RHIMIDRAFT_242972 [Rhizopus microsporus ATCC 52813]|uniref:Uncharacterized protein n=1 Tax=Rhizopus microsporus ATCC 52813 TaxID=1340429 RepID=A0A2G4SEF3_RHIZD|nr:uncharacterized protein RHIMIDRAFT_242972 [Rhizopus microsporus ATCC 52813]PHZ07172.1 hypothetical protein RHIMIDRAFT_242972 [Rhizopus microsporus ATCC 52813]